MNKDWLVGWVGAVVIILAIIGAIVTYNIKSIGKDSNPGLTERERRCLEVGGTYHYGECVRCNAP